MDGDLGGSGSLFPAFHLLAWPGATLSYLDARTGYRLTVTELTPWASASPSKFLPVLTGHIFSPWGTQYRWGSEGFLGSDQNLLNWIPSYSSSLPGPRQELGSCVNRWKWLHCFSLPRVGREGGIVNHCLTSRAVTALPTLANKWMSVFRVKLNLRNVQLVRKSILLDIFF